MEDDSPKALPVVEELSNSGSDRNASVFIWGISNKAAQRKSITANEGLFHSEQEKLHRRSEPVHRLGRSKGRLRLLRVSSI